ncbi:MAG: site-specific integrase, partial [Bacteroidota bacterium]
MIPKLAVILYKSKRLKNGEHPLMLRVSGNNQRKHVSLGVSSPAALWDDQKLTPKRNHPQKEFLKSLIQCKINAYQQAAIKHKEDIHTPEDLIAIVEKGRVKEQAVFPFFEEVIDRLMRAGKVGNANVYKDAKKALKKFVGDRPILFMEMNTKFLHEYETFLRSRGLADTTLSVYFRTLRTLCKKAIKEERTKAEHYPFKHFNVSKFNIKTKKRAISKEEITRLEQLSVPSDSPLFNARSYFLFSYYGQGINFRDMAQLRWKDFVKGRIFYKRAKTGKYLQFKLLPPALEILTHYRDLTGTSLENYIFPILKKDVHVTPKQLDNRTDKVLKQVNTGLKVLAKMAGITTSLTTYVARHTYATVLKNSGVPIQVISEALG